MPTHYQQDSFQALLALFLEAKGPLLPEHRLHPLICWMGAKRLNWYSLVLLLHLVLLFLLLEIRRLRLLAGAQGFDIQRACCKI